MDAGTMYSSTRFSASSTGSRDFRLLEIAEAPDSAVVECKLHGYALGSPTCPSYAALSYAWGSATNLKEIRCDGAPVLVRENLWAFLLQMRRLRRWRFFWIDALCVDLSNAEERSRQVELVRDIYSTAATVTIWLGPAAENSEIGMDCISKSPIRKRRRFFSRIWSRKQGKAVLALCERPYWRRLWIMQEIALAKQLEVHCGEKSFGWNCVDAMHERLKEVVIEGRVEHHPFAAAVLESYAGALIQRIEAWKEAQPADGGSALKLLLEICQDMDCTDVRDKIYGVLGLVQSCEKDKTKPTISPSYSKSASEIYVDALRAVFMAYEFASIEDRIRFIEMLQRSLGVSSSDSFIELETTNALLTCDTKSSGRSRPCSPLGMIALLASGTNNPSLLLDEKTLQELASRFNHLMSSIQERWQALDGESQLLRAPPPAIPDDGAIPSVDDEIARWQTVLGQIDELQRELDKVRKIGTIVKKYRARVEDLDRRLKL